MLEQLSTFRAQGRVQPGRVVLAATLHGLVIFGAIRATAPRRVEAGAGGTRQVDLIAVPLPAQAPEPALAVSQDAEVVAAPSVEELLTAPSDVPPAIPPITPGPALDPSVLRRALAPGTLVRAAPGPAAADRILAAGEVDEPATTLFQPAPRYPPVLQAAGFEGRVLLEFVIDTTGHAEPASLRVIERTREGFDVAALETLQRSLFRPARIGGRPVRQRTLQWVVFRIAAP